MSQMDLSASEKRSHPLGYIWSPFCRSFCVVPSSGAVIFWTIYDDVRQLQDLEISVGVQWYIIQWWICFFNFCRNHGKSWRFHQKIWKSLKSHQIKHLVLSSICSIMIGGDHVTLSIVDLSLDATIKLGHAAAPCKCAFFNWKHLQMGADIS